MPENQNPDGENENRRRRRGLPDGFPFGLPGMPAAGEQEDPQDGNTSGNTSGNDEAGDDETRLSPAMIKVARKMLRRINGGDATGAVGDVVKALQAAQKAATNFEGILTGLLEARPDYFHLEAVRQSPAGEPLAIVRRGNQITEVPVHPDVDLAEISNLKPWEYVLVNTNEMVLTGVWRDDMLLDRMAQGELVEFKNRHESHAGLAIATRPGRGDHVIHLTAEVADRELTPGTKLVMMRDSDVWAIDSIAAEQSQSRWEVDVADITTRLSDLAGLEEVAQQILEQLLVRTATPELREEFTLEAIKGVVMYSTKPGQGKTTMVRALVNHLHEIGQRNDEFDVALYVVPPTALKSKWHGEDGENVRNLFGSIRARCAAQQGRRLFLFVVFDEVENLGNRMGDEYSAVSSAHNDVSQALLNEMDGVVKQNYDNASVVFWGLTNKLEGLDPALRRAGRFGDLVIEFPEYTMKAAENIMMTSARGESLPWYVDRQVRAGVPEEDIRRGFLQPALAHAYNMPVLHYSTQTERRVTVTAGKVLAAVNFKNCMTQAKHRAATRKLHGAGVPAMCPEDVLDTLVSESRNAAAQLIADKAQMRRVLNVKGPVTGAELTPHDEMNEHRYVRMSEN